MRTFVRTTLAWVLLAVLGENLVAPGIAVRGIAPDFTVIAIVLLGMARGPTTGAIGGFCLGLVQDLASPTTLGAHALAKTLLGCGIGRTRGRLVYGMVLVEASLLLVAVIGHDTVLLLLQGRQQGDFFAGPWLATVLPTALYTAVVGVPLLRLADLAGIVRQEE